MSKLHRHHRPNHADRRSYNRFEGKGVMASINQKLVEVLDISLGGLSLSPDVEIPDGSVPLVLIPREGGKLLLNDGVATRATLVFRDDRSCHLSFDRLTISLAKLIIRHTAEGLGVQPFLFK